MVSVCQASYLDYIYQDRSITSNSFGQSGLIQTPTAEIKSSGTISFTYNKNNIYKLGTLSVAPFNWMEASYFYYRPSDLKWGGVPGYYLDKGFSVKFNKNIHFLNNTKISLGLDDFAGTGLFAREYLAVTSNINFAKITGGIGWGKYAGIKSYKNPLSYISNTFEYREGFELQQIYDTGRPSTNKWFKGPVGFFGGAEIYIPKAKGMKLKIEYDPFDYMDFSCCGEGYSYNSIELRNKDSNINYGLSIPINKNMILDLSYISGNKFNLSFTYEMNFSNIKEKKSPPPSVYQKTKDSDGTKKGFHRDLLSNMNNNGYFLQYANLKDKKLDVVIQNNQYRSPILLSSYAAKLANEVAVKNNYNIDYVSVSHMNAGMGLNKITYKSKDLENKTKYQSLVKRKAIIESISDADINLYQFKPKPVFPFSSTSFDYEIAAHAGSPEQFLYKGLVLTLNNQTQFSRKLHLDSKISYLSQDDFNEKSSRPDSALPHVRSEIVSYLQQSELYIDHLQLNFYNSFKDNIYSKLSLGILESMYGGFGGEFLYTPFNKNISLSASLHKVYRRDYDRKFDFLDYSTVTGHVEASYFNNKSNILAQVSYGKYLAGDRGFTLDLSRVLDSGFRTGFYFTRTNVSFELFGEGSFDKGFYFIIPFDIFSKKYSRGTINFAYAPLTRDGGQKLLLNKTIKSLIFNSNKYQYDKYWHDFLN
jgi:hypothetical protein|tara:strand:+ start:5156 stop:7261 length:2106 start_codon:yes stop_codon:yes gene_type:complete